MVNGSWLMAQGWLGTRPGPRGRRGGGGLLEVHMYIHMSLLGFSSLFTFFWFRLLPQNSK